jgi:hypothetical protein
VKKNKNKENRRIAVSFDFGPAAHPLHILLGVWYLPSLSTTICVSPHVLHEKTILVTSGRTLLTRTTVPWIAIYFPARNANTSARLEYVRSL